MTGTRKTYHHYCPAAKALEIVGEKWSLLIVRDLLAGPQRFTDLLQFLGGITPKWLTVRLRDLETAGIVEREHESGRREVWYRLTAKGRDLAPVIEALLAWGIEYAVQPPEPGEPTHPGQATGALVTFFNRRGIGLDHPARWLLRFPPDRAYAVVYDGNTWSIARGVGDAAPFDLEVSAPSDDWTAFLQAPPESRAEYLSRFTFSGRPQARNDLLTVFGWKVGQPRSRLAMAAAALREATA